MRGCIFGQALPRVGLSYDGLAALNPIGLRDGSGCSLSFLSSSNTTLKYLSCVESFRITAANFRTNTNQGKAAHNREDSESNCELVVYDTSNSLRSLGALCVSAFSAFSMNDINTQQTPLLDLSITLFREETAHEKTQSTQRRRERRERRNAES
jgi:hypothetical protein